MMSGEHIDETKFKYLRHNQETNYAGMTSSATSAQ